MKQLFMFTTYMKIKQNHYLKNGSSNRIYKNVIYKKKHCGSYEKYEYIFRPISFKLWGLNINMVYSY